MGIWASAFFVTAFVWLTFEAHLWTLEQALEKPKPDEPWVRKMMQTKVEETKSPHPTQTLELYIIATCCFAVLAFLTT